MFFQKRCISSIRNYESWNGNNWIKFCNLDCTRGQRMWSLLSFQGLQFNLLWTRFPPESQDSSSSLLHCFRNRNHDIDKREVWKHWLTCFHVLRTRTTKMQNSYLGPKMVNILHLTVSCRLHACNNTKLALSRLCWLFKKKKLLWEWHVRSSVRSCTA